MTLDKGEGSNTILQWYVIYQQPQSVDGQSFMKAESRKFDRLTLSAAPLTFFLMRKVDVAAHV